MTDRRLVKRDHVRELIHVADMNDPTCKLVALTDDQLEILRVVVRYAHRRINWNDEDITVQAYLLPNDEKWDEISDLVSDLECRLMQTCDISALIDSIDSLLCICTKLDSLATGIDYLAETVSLDVGGQTVLPILEAQYPTPEDADLIEGTTVPAVDLEICELANTIWGWGTETITEKMIPLASSVSDKLAVAITVTEVFIIATGGIGLVPGVAAMLFTAIVKWLADSAIANLQNWIDGSGQEAVCALYSGFVSGSWAGAQANLAAFIDAEPQLAGGDKFILRWFLCTDYVEKAVQYSIAQALLEPDDYFTYLCTGCGIPAGCYDCACDSEDWIIQDDCFEGFVGGSGWGGGVTIDREFDPGTYRVTAKFYLYNPATVRCYFETFGEQVVQGYGWKDIDFNVVVSEYGLYAFGFNPTASNTYITELCVLPV